MCVPGALNVSPDTAAGEGLGAGYAGLFLAIGGNKDQHVFAGGGGPIARENQRDTAVYTTTLLGVQSAKPCIPL